MEILQSSTKPSIFSLVWNDSYRLDKLTPVGCTYHWKIHPPKKFSNTSACWITENKPLLEWSKHRKYCMLPARTKGLSPVVKRIGEAVQAHLRRLLAALDQGRGHRRRTRPRQPMHIHTTWILSTLVKMATIINGGLYQTGDAHQSILSILNSIQTVVNVNFVLKKSP